MLLEFKVSNFCSIREEQVLSFVGTADSEDLSDNFTQPQLPEMGDTKVLKAIVIYGANASGKSNILKALQFFAYFAANSFKGFDPEESTGTQPFGLESEWAERSTTFEITAIIDDIRTTYGLALTDERVTEEYLVAFPEGKPELYFERTWNSESKSMQWQFPNSNFSVIEEVRNSVRDNCTLLSAGAQFNHPQLTAVHRWWTKKLRVLSITRGNRLVEETAERWLSATPELRDIIFRLTKLAEPSLTKINVEQIEKEADKNSSLRHFPRPRRINDQIFLSHKGRDGDVLLPFVAQSTGTQRFFGLIGPLLQALDGHGVLCIDEIETSLHPLLVQTIFHIFGDIKIQLLVTTHNAQLLDRNRLRPDQIWFTEKDQAGATRLYPLTDYKQRPEEPLVNGYLAGRYGGIPFIPESIIL